MDYMRRHKIMSRAFSPTLERHGRNWYLRIAFKDATRLVSEKDIGVITAVDLGINNAAACCAMLPDGTVTGRKIITLPVEKDQMKHKLNKIKKAQQHGARRMPRLWAYANNTNRAIAGKTAKAIIDFAVEHNSDAIAFEHLSFKGKIHGSKAQRLHLWRKQAVQQIVACRAHQLGIRVSGVNPWGTSELAFDGSGRVRRDGKNHSICTFSTGKVYHSDLNASYNIGARYWIQKILKSLPETARLEVEAKVPQLSKRTTCVLTSLISLNAALCA
jgi:IS605 OrfB family transposase